MAALADQLLNSGHEASFCFQSSLDILTPDANRSGVTTFRVNASQEKLLLIQW
ncbi:hypothetical protein CORAM0001_0164 [Corynebacterium amycolatum SK46]|nr:hypothetical protein CORAM0001_0164 [Corynebacterium amycolatum SK46]